MDVVVLGRLRLAGHYKNSISSTLCMHTNPTDRGIQIVVTSAARWINKCLLTYQILQLFYDPFSGTTRVRRCQKRTFRLYGARGD